MKKFPSILVMLLCLCGRLDCFAQSAASEELQRAQRLIQSGELTEADGLDSGTAHHPNALVLARPRHLKESMRQEQIAAELDKKDVQTRRDNMLTVLP